MKDWRPRFQRARKRSPSPVEVRYDAAIIKDPAKRKALEAAVARRSSS
jgi:hypothetical protein